MEIAQLGLSHAYSRVQCTFDASREDKPILQSIALIDQLDKNINSFCMRVKEWFGWHFPELSKIVSDNSSYIKTVKLIKNKENLLADRDALEVKLVKLLEDEETVAKVFDAAKASMGGGLNELDELNIKYFCKKVSSLIQFKEHNPKNGCFGTALSIKTVLENANKWKIKFENLNSSKGSKNRD